MDHGPEFEGQALDAWAYKRAVRLAFIHPGKPVENAYVESFNGQVSHVLADHAASGMRVTVDDNIATPGFVKFYIRKRVGGIVTNNEAVRLLKCAAS